jgi:hypothetical protein
MKSSAVKVQPGVNLHHHTFLFALSSGGKGRSSGAASTVPWAKGRESQSKAKRHESSSWHLRLLHLFKRGTSPSEHGLALGSTCTGLPVRSIPSTPRSCCPPTPSPPPPLAPCFHGDPQSTSSVGPEPTPATPPAQRAMTPSTSSPPHRQVVVRGPQHVAKGAGQAWAWHLGCTPLRKEAKPLSQWRDRGPGSRMRRQRGRERAARGRLRGGLTGLTLTRRVVSVETCRGAPGSTACEVPCGADTAQSCPDDSTQQRQLRC